MAKPLIVAEISANHLGSFGRAQALVEAAADAGADAVKFQTFQPQQMAVRHVLEDGPWAGRTLNDLYQEAYLPRHWHSDLFRLARDRGLVPFSTPFHPDDVDFLETLDCPMYKIASFELVDLRLIRHAARTGKPLVMSTGMATKAEIQMAARTALDVGCGDITLLKCTSAYPADASAANLATMCDWWLQQGISDHSPGLGVAVAAAALGVTYIEKHMTLSRADGGPDAAFSMEPDEFKQMAIECRRAAAAIGEVRYGPSESEQASLKLRRSLYFARDLPAGHVLTADDLRSARPALGMSPENLDALIGGQLGEAVHADQPVSWGVFYAKCTDCK